MHMAYTYTRVLHLWTYTTGTYTNKRGRTWFWICFQEVFCSFVSWHIFGVLSSIHLYSLRFWLIFASLFSDFCKFLSPSSSVDRCWLGFLHCIVCYFPYISSLHIFVTSFHCPMASLIWWFSGSLSMFFAFPSLFFGFACLFRVPENYWRDAFITVYILYCWVLLVLPVFLFFLLLWLWSCCVRKALWTFEAGGRLGGGHSASPTGAQSRPLCLFFACSGSASWSFCFCYSPSCPSSS